MKRILSAMIAAFFAFSFLAGAEVTAAEGAYITQYYSSENTITAYVSGISSDNIDVHISGISCDAVNNGSIYSNSDKYETYFLIDSSKSMQSFSDEIDSFLRECIDKKTDNEYYSIGLFSSGNNPEYIISGEKNQYSLEKTIDGIKYDFNSTYIYDNLINTIKQLTNGNDTHYKRIVLITDGNENSAKGITIDDVTDELRKSPVPVYTVTLQTKDKSNLENLKNISRLARFSNSEDMRISDGEDAAAYAKILTDNAKNTYCIEITADKSLLDGSVKAVEISDGSLYAAADLRMYMLQSSETVPETSDEIVETTISETVTTMTETTAQSEQETTSGGSTVIIAVLAISVAVVCVVFIVITVTKDKKKKTQTDTSVSHADNDETLIITGGGRQTEILIENEQPQHRSLVLRDTADSVRTFEVQLSQSGTVIGRSSDMADIVIDYDKAVSRKHCRIYLNGGKAYIEDLSSGNKTYVNNTEVTSPYALSNADEIKIGRTKLKVTLK